MTRISTLALTAVLVAAATPSFAGTDCGVGYKTFMGSMQAYVNKSTGDDLADAIRKSLVAYDSCKAGDDFSPRGVWDKILADMKGKSTQ